MLNVHSEIMTNCRLRSEKAANLEEVLSIKLSLKHSLSIFAIAHLQSPEKVNVLSNPIWLMLRWLSLKSGWR